MASRRSPNFFLLGDNSRALQRFEVTLRGLLRKAEMSHLKDFPRYLRSEFWKDKDVTAARCILVLPHAPRQIIFDESHPSRSFHAEVQKIEQAKGEVFIVVYGPEDLKDTKKLYGHDIELLFKSGVQAKLRDYSKDRLLGLFHGQGSELNKTQRKMIVKFLDLKNFQEPGPGTEEWTLNQIDTHRGNVFEVLARLASDVRSLVPGDGRETLPKEKLKKLNGQLLDLIAKIENIREPVKAELLKVEGEEQPSEEDRGSSDHLIDVSAENDELPSLMTERDTATMTPSEDELKQQELAVIEDRDVPEPAGEPSMDGKQTPSDGTGTEKLESEERDDNGQDGIDQTDQLPRNKKRRKEDGTETNAKGTFDKILSTGNGDGKGLQPQQAKQAQNSGSETPETRTKKSKPTGQSDQLHQKERDPEPQATPTEVSEKDKEDHQRSGKPQVGSPK